VLCYVSPHFFFFFFFTLIIMQAILYKQDKFGTYVEFFQRHKQEPKSTTDCLESAITSTKIQKKVDQYANK